MGHREGTLLNQRTDSPLLTSIADQPDTHRQLLRSLDETAQTAVAEGKSEDAVTVLRRDHKLDNATTKKRVMLTRPDLLNRNRRSRTAGEPLRGDAAVCQTTSALEQSFQNPRISASPELASPAETFSNGIVERFERRARV
jgi:hypothetical protein